MVKAITRARWGLSQVADVFESYIFTVKGMTSGDFNECFAPNQELGD